MDPRLVLPLLLFPTFCPAQSDLVHYWPLDETSGTTVTDLAGGPPGALLGPCEWDPTGGHHAGALHFNGSGARVEMGPCDITTGTGDALTLACWMRPDLASVNEKMLLAKTTGNTGSDMIWSLSVVNVSAVRFRVRTGASTLELTSSPSSVLTGTWYHVAATYDGMDLVLYVNGAQVASMSGAGLLGYHPQAPATMGSLSDGSQTFFGRLDDVRIYDRALEQSEVIDLVIGSIATSVPDPLSALVHANGLLTGLPPGVVVDLEVRDMLGRLEHRDVLTPSCTTYDLDGLAPGYHLICLATPGSRTVLPFLRP